MKNVFSLMMVMALLLVGCAAMDRGLNSAAPNQIVNGVEVPGTHTATQLTQDIANAIPYGGVVLPFLLLCINFVQKVQANRLTKGLKATIQAIEIAGKDPSTAAAIAQLKIELSHAHEIADVQPLVNNIMKKLGFPAGSTIG